ncbi:response regulator transcription factor [Roseateles sp. DAIF2]|uniref:response regulator transcription factor n=1 Tax=Roseateles sp. DAIF2 TaxID=2714952 RepID=UPI0018A25776|nr:response regulator transcription factor [Roseateles sp. DAIF2]QPF73403.1 response regulator transcription factor [Roseateles sp. DAIF2]
MRPAALQTRVIIADDHRLVREGLCALLRSEPDIAVVAEARDGMELVRLVRELQPDVALVDLAMPRMNGIEAIRRIRAEPGLSCKLLCVSAHQLPQQVQAALDAGANGYVLKENSFDELARGVRRVMAGQLFLSGELVGAVLDNYRHPASAPTGASTLGRLTPRERQMVQLLSEGYSAQQIAEQLHLSAKTVATHREHVFSKLRIQGIAELTRFALREGLSSLDARPPHC